MLDRLICFGIGVILGFFLCFDVLFFISTIKFNKKPPSKDDWRMP